MRHRLSARKREPSRSCSAYLRFGDVRIVQRRAILTAIYAGGDKGTRVQRAVHRTGRMNDSESGDSRQSAMPCHCLMQKRVVYGCINNAAISRVFPSSSRAAYNLKREK